MPPARPQWDRARSLEAAQGGSNADGAVAVAREDDQLAEAVLQGYISVYHGAGKVDAVCDESLRRVREHLLSCQSGAVVCLICLEAVRRTDAVWSCQRSCSCDFHLLCIQAWSRQQLAAAALKAKDAVQRGDGAVEVEPLVWCCPKCRCEYSPVATPNEYRCYCGKQVDPAADPWLAPHTCGETCGRDLGSCGHACSLLCHPGPCPTCPRLVEARCFCGKVESTRRCQAAAFSCGKLCGRQHPCGHRCGRLCHEGDCPPCKLSAERTCQCGAETASVPCAAPEFRCARVCGSLLRCGRHRCERVCHGGPCGGCPSEGLRTCPCGKAEYGELSCDEPTPTCGDTCDKVLGCGEHRCVERCHAGPCPAVCRAPVPRTCACRRLEKTVPCCEPLRCEFRCRRTRNCGRHACRARCCDGDCPPCSEACGRTLRCGNHRCPATCHEGACLPCPLEFSVACACGAAAYRLPCGWEARAAPPACSAPCPVPPTCRHVSQLPAHRCHFGSCPTCDHPCGTRLSCGHDCAAAACHDASPPAVADFQRPAPPSSPAYVPVRPEPRVDGEAGVAPAQQAAAAAAVMVSDGAAQRACPPCSVLVRITCLGGHEQMHLPCCESQPRPCPRACGRQLACGSHFESGVHTCGKPCHVVSAPGVEAGPECEACGLACGRHRACGHPCSERCHAGACPPCEQPVVLPCHCGKSSVTLTCYATESEDSDQQAGVSVARQCGRPCWRPLPMCPHPCQRPCHPGGCSCECGEQVTVRCACRRRKEKMLCSDVQRALSAQAGGSGCYDASTALRVLSCNSQCKDAEGAKLAAMPATQSPAQIRSEVGAAPEPKVTPPQRAGKRRLNKQERLAEKAAAEAAAQKGAFLRVGWDAGQTLQRTAVPLTMVLLGICLAVYMQQTFL